RTIMPGLTPPCFGRTNVYAPRGSGARSALHGPLYRSRWPTGPGSCHSIAGGLVVVAGGATSRAAESPSAASLSTSGVLGHERHGGDAPGQPREPQQVARAEDELPAFGAVGGVDTGERRLLGVEAQAAAPRRLAQVEVGERGRDVAGIKERGGVHVLEDRPS